jgi:hypothetical protein
LGFGCVVRNGRVGVYDAVSIDEIDVPGLRKTQDEASKAHADIIDFTCGVGG